MAFINAELCNGCTLCLMYCPPGAIHMDGKKAVIAQEECVECYVCVRKDVCPRGAIFAPVTLSEGREFRHFLSDPTETKPLTGVPGRGTEEAKTNDVTGRTKRGEVGICIDMGRPGVGVWMRDVQKVSMAMARVGLAFEECSPLTAIMKDKSTGEVRDDMLDEHLLSIIVEGTVPEERFTEVIRVLREVEPELDTVFSLGVISRVDDKGNAPFMSQLDAAGLDKPIRAKINVGLGRPLVP